jgi:hypothetical protein
MASSGLKRYAAEELMVCALAAIWRSGVMSSRTQKPRPYVPMTRSFWWLSVWTVEVADRSAGQVLAQRLPVIAVVEADVNGGLCAGEEQAGLLGIGAQAVHPASGALVAGRPFTMLTQVLPPSVVRQMSGTSASSRRDNDAARSPRRCGRQHRRYCVIAGHNGAEAGVRRHVRNVADVVPDLAMIHGVVDLAVAAYGPHHAALDRGDGEVVDGGWGRGRTTGAGSWRWGRPQAAGVAGFAPQAT